MKVTLTQVNNVTQQANSSKGKESFSEIAKKIRFDQCPQTDLKQRCITSLPHNAIPGLFR